MRRGKRLLFVVNNKETCRARPGIKPQINQKMPLAAAFFPFDGANCM
jgi:hypothetical protein